MGWKDDAEEYYDRIDPDWDDGGGDYGVRQSGLVSKADSHFLWSVCDVNMKR